MYNGVGLQTPRGSGGSGFVQRNLSTVNPAFKKNNNREEFLKELEELRKNNLPPIRKANPEIVEHERKREILIHTMKLREKLKADGIQEEEILKAVKKAEVILKEKMDKGDLQTRAKESHILTEAKQKQYMKLSKAFGLKTNNQIGSAFNFEGEKDARLKRMEEKRLKKPEFACSAEGCGKSYDLKELFNRHLKYKHPELYVVAQQKEREAEKKRRAEEAERRQVLRERERSRENKKRQREREREREREKKKDRQHRDQRERQRDQEKEKQKEREKDSEKDKEKKGGQEGELETQKLSQGNPNEKRTKFEAE